jgi:heat shock protein HtpX
MKLGKRIMMFLMVNVLVLVSISIVMNILGVGSYVTAQGIDFKTLILFCAIWGFGGAFISLAISRMMAKWMMGVRLVSPETQHPEERWLYQTVKRLSEQAGLNTTPEVGVFDSAEPNAFATGPTKSRALVAISSGLMQTMNKSEIEGVLAHEVAHIANGDMVTMTLIQGVVNAFVMFFARIIGWAASQLVDEDKRGIVNFISVIVFEILLSFLGMIVVAAFSRQREYRADAGAAQLAGSEKMIGALKSLQRFSEHPSTAPASMAALQISSGSKSGLLALLSTHPPLSERINKLQQAAVSRL